jgi:hypothetical protein
LNGCPIAFDCLSYKKTSFFRPNKVKRTYLIRKSGLWKRNGYFKSARRVIYERKLNKFNKGKFFEKLDISVRFHILIRQAYLKFSSEAKQPVLRIRDAYPGSQIPIFSIPDPNYFHAVSRIRIEECKSFIPKKLFLSTRKYDLGCSGS